jgi:hypothetical protein
MNFLKKLIKKIFKITASTYQFYNIIELQTKNGYLKETGWTKSVRNGMSVDKNGSPIPWFTYPMNDFIEARLMKDMDVFEYGSGNSTLYFAKKVCHIVSVEHEESWYKLIKSRLPENATYLFCEPDDSRKYPETILKTDKYFDIVIIDGRQRVECAKAAIIKLKPNGVIIWDNSLRNKYAEGMSFLANRGFKRIDFMGLNPIGICKTVTSIFYKNDNVFNI